MTNFYKKPQIWVKSYPFPKEVQALTDLGSENIGMEVFLGSNMQKNEECLRICKDSYPRFGIELFCYQDEERGQRSVIYNPNANTAVLRELSRDYLFRILELGVQYGATHVQLDGNDGYNTKPGMNVTVQDIDVAVSLKKSLLFEIKQRFGIMPMYFENTIPIDDNSPDLIFSLTGHRLSDFWQQGLSFEYDLAHHAIALDVYSRAAEFGYYANEEELYLGQRVREVGITQTVLEDLAKFETIYFTHLGNASAFFPQTKTDIIPQDKNKELVDLEQVLPVVMKKSLNVAPEVVDTDYVVRPNLRAWVRRLQEYEF